MVRWQRRKRKWPAIDLYSKGGSGSIKMLSAAGLERLMGKAARSRWSAEGRPEWFEQHRPEVRDAALVLFGREGASLYRCIATVFLADGSGARFTLDVEIGDFEALDDLGDKELVVMAHRYLGTFPALDLDPGQADSWDGSVWERWGRST